MKKEVLITEDGSPSLLFYKEEDKQLMHSSFGAFSETEYIYGEAIDKILEIMPNKVFCFSLGLGLAYVEISSILRFHLQNRDFHLITYEKEEDLKEALMDFLNDKKSIYEKEYQNIFKHYEKHWHIPSEKIKSLLKEALKQKKWQMHGAFDFQDTNKAYHLILFDAFCARFDENLWQKETLKDWLKDNAAATCVFATYAAKGSLKRALKENDFETPKRKGFAKKRESILAHRFDSETKT